MQFRLSNEIKLVTLMRVSAKLLSGYPGHTKFLSGFTELILCP